MRLSNDFSFSEKTILITVELDLLVRNLLRILNDFPEIKIIIYSGMNLNNMMKQRYAASNPKIRFFRGR